MRAYYAAHVKKRMDKLNPAQRRKVIRFARSEAEKLASSGDIQPELFAVLPWHLDACGFLTRKHSLSARAEMEEAFFSFYKDGIVGRANGQYLSDKIIRKLMKIPGNDFNFAFKHFSAGWQAGRMYGGA